MLRMCFNRDGLDQISVALGRRLECWKSGESNLWGTITATGDGSEEGSGRTWELSANTWRVTICEKLPVCSYFRGQELPSLPLLRSQNTPWHQARVQKTTAEWTDTKGKVDAPWDIPVGEMRRKVMFLLNVGGELIIRIIQKQNWTRHWDHEHLRSVQVFKLTHVTIQTTRRTAHFCPCGTRTWMAPQLFS